MTPALRWPENAERVRMESLANTRHIRDLIRCVMRNSREIETIKQLSDALEVTYEIECDLKSVGAKAEKEQRTMGY